MKLPPNFNPSPFEQQGGGDDKNKNKEEFIDQVLNILGINKQQQQPPKHKTLPVIVYILEKGEHHVFQHTAMRREDKDMVLGHLYEWFMERQALTGYTGTKQEWIEIAFKDRYDAFLE